MSNRYKHVDTVPADVLCARLEELASAVYKGPDEVRREFTMRIPAELDRDADVVLSEAAKRLRDLEADKSSGVDLPGFVSWLFRSVWPHGDADGGDLQDMGVKYGILRPETATKPCGEECICAEVDDFPQACYRLHESLIASKEGQ